MRGEFMLLSQLAWPSLPLSPIMPNVILSRRPHGQKQAMGQLVQVEEMIRNGMLLKKRKTPYHL